MEGKSMENQPTLRETKKHGAAWFPFNIYPCAIPLDFTQVALHWQDSMELVFVKKGRGIVQAGLTSYTAAAGDIYVFAPGVLHALRQLDNERMEYENIIFSLSMLLPGKYDYTKEDFLTPLLAGRFTVPTVFTPVYPYYEDVVAPIDACDEICKTMPQGYQLYIKSKLYEFFFVLDNRCRNLTKPLKSKKTLDKMKVVLKYVENNYADKISIADIADVAGFSESHFMRYFKETMGTSFVDYLKDYRLTMAARLLQSSDSSVLSISGEVGFESLSYFNRAFKKHYGMTPLQYRKGS